MLNPFSNRKVIRNGEPARAWVRRMPSPPRGANAQSVEMTLDVERANGFRFEVQDRWMVAAGEPISVGSELCVLVDPEDHDRVAIDWSGTRQVYREKTAERRRLLSAGVPVPVSKLKEVSDGRRAVAVPLTQTPAEEAIGTTRRFAPVEEARRNHEKKSAVAVAEPHALDTREADELLSRLERLASLHAAGSLTDDEFAAVKRHLLG